MNQREIKFRVWDTEYKSFKYGDYSISVFGDVRGKYGEEFPTLQAHQYTGLKDKNGQAIYKGDIIQGGDKCEHCVVKWDVSNARYIAIGRTYKVFAHKFHLFKIIGNIYENPELV